jgi:hypothetical protein
VLGGCAAEALVAPQRAVQGVWRGSEWSLAADRVIPELHHLCGVARVNEVLIWDDTLGVRGTASWIREPMSSNPDLAFAARALRDGRVILEVSGAYGRTDTLRRARRDQLQGGICD